MERVEVITLKNDNSIQELKSHIDDSGKDKFIVEFKGENELDYSPFIFETDYPNFKTVSYSEKSETEKVDRGLFLFDKSISKRITPGMKSIRKELIPLLERDNEIKEVFTWKYRDERRPCLFLDRDGIIIEDSEYPYQIEDLKLIPEVVSLIKKAKEMDWFVVVITNQSGIARGIFTEEDYQEAEAHIDKVLKSKDARPDRWYFSPYHAEKGIGEYQKESLLRKPNPGMVYKALNDFPIDIKRSVMVGDKKSDIIDMPFLKTKLLQGNYDLAGASEIFSSLKEIENTLFQ